MVTNLVLLFDCDNTLIDNDAAKEEYGRRLETMLGADGAAAFWSTYEEVRAERTVVDIPATISRFAAANEEQQDGLTRLFFDFPFASFVYADVPRVLAHAQTMGSVAVLSDGDQLFQRHKITMSGLEDLVHGAVYVFDHKELAIPRLVRDLIAERYVTVDDKPYLLGALKAAIDAPLTTVFVRQGKYAAANPAAAGADFTLDSISDFLNLTARDLAAPSGA